MSYQSLGFIVFVIIALFLYYIVGRKRQIWVLAIANIIFYAMAGIKYIPFIFVTMSSTYIAGRVIDSIYQNCDEEISKCKEKDKIKNIKIKAKSKAKVAIFISLLISVCLLVICKYTNFIIQNIKIVFPQLNTFKLILPIGISYYTFMATSYVLDIYWRRYKAEKSFLLYAVFLSYFPHVAQGPIDRFNEFKEQIKDGIPLKYKNLTFGAQLAIWGFFKKLVIADSLGVFVAMIFDNWQLFNAVYLITAIIVYSIQIYADFSGCIDIVRGVSEMFGINLRKNFNHPYFSKTIEEFWRRWHMSLQEWFKDYIYYPVSLSNFSRKVKKYFKAKNMKRIESIFAYSFPILVVWIITGLWHGAEWKYVIWGIFHAVLLIGSKLFEPFFIKLKKIIHLNDKNSWWKFIQISRTFILCCIGRIFFRAKDVSVAVKIIKKVFLQISPSLLLKTKPLLAFAIEDLVLVIISVWILLFVDIIQEKIHIRETLAKQHIVIRWSIIFVGLFCVIIFGNYGPEYNASDFIYEQF